MIKILWLFFIVMHEKVNAKLKVVGNKAIGWISKRTLKENKARQIFRKTNIS